MAPVDGSAHSKRETLSPEDARILALESGTIRGHTCKVVVFAGAHDAAAVRARVASGLDAFPRLTQRLAQVSGPPAWTPDPAFDLARHVAAREPVKDDHGLRGLVGEAMATRLDRERPLWAMDVVPLGGERTALVWRIHHAIADGMTAMRMLRDLLFEPSLEEPRRPPREQPRRARRGGATARALGRELGAHGVRSPLDRPAGPRREVAFVDAPLDELRRIGHAAPEHATVNDVVLAAVGAGLRGWLSHLGAPAAGLRVKVPVSLHRRDEQDAANRDSFIVVDLPLEQSDPLERLVAVARETRERKRDHDAETLDAFFRDLSHLSRSLERFAARWAMNPRIFTLNVSNVPGPSGPQSVLGAPLLELHSLAEIANRHTLRVAVVSAAGRISFGLCADPDAVDGLELIAEGIEGEILALGASVPSGP